jgi:hypothetical protein
MVLEYRLHNIQPDRHHTSHNLLPSLAFAYTITRAVKTIAWGSDNELLVELLTDLANQMVRETIWKSPLDYQTRAIRRTSADLMASTLKVIRLRKPNAAVTHLSQLLEGDRDRALATLSQIRGEAFDLSAISHPDEQSIIPDKVAGAAMKQRA